MLDNGLNMQKKKVCELWLDVYELSHLTKDEYRLPWSPRIAIPY